MRLSGRPPRIHDHYPPRLPPRNRRKSIAHAPKKSPSLLLKPILIMPARRTLRIPLIPPTRPAHARMRVRIQQNRQLRLQIPTNHPMQLPHRVAPQPPPAPLICLSRIRKPIAQHDRPRRQPWRNDLRDMLRPRRKHQSHLRPRIQPSRPRVEQHLPDLFSCRSSTGLTRLDYFMPCLAQRRRELPHLRALARPIEPFKRDELPAPRHRRNDTSQSPRERGFLCALRGSSAISAVKSFYR